MSNRKTLSGALYTSVPALFLNFISVLVTPLIIRQLGKEQYGQWTASVSLTTLVFLLASFGLRPLFIRRIADASVEAEKETAYQLGIRGGLGVLSLFLSLVICFALGYPRTVFLCTLVATVSAFTVSLNSALGDVLQGNQNLKLLSGINFVSGLFLTILSVVVVLCGGGPVAVALAYMSGPFLSSVLLVLSVQKYYFPVRILWDKAVFVERFQEARLVGISQIFAASRDRLEHILVPKLVGIPSYGIFSASTVLTDRLSIVSSSLGDAFFAPIARAVQDGQERVSQQVGNLLLAGIAFCIPLSLILSFLSKLLASVLLPFNIFECTSIILITVWSLPIYAVWQGMVVSLQATKAQDEAAKANIGTTLFSVAITSFLIFRYDLLGAAVSQITRPVVGCLIYYKVFNPRFPGVLAKIFTIRLVICFLVMACVLFLGKEYFAPALEQLTQYAPWVTRKMRHFATHQQILQSYITVLLMLLWALMSLFIFLVTAILLKLLSAESLLKYLKRNQK